MDEDPLHFRIYFLTFVESLEIIFSQYTETCEVMLYYPIKGGGAIEYYSKYSIRNLLTSKRTKNINIHYSPIIHGCMNTLKGRV